MLSSRNFESFRGELSRLKNRSQKNVRLQYLCDVKHARQSINLETDKSVADELFSVDNSKFEKRVCEGSRQLVHRGSRTILFENSHPFPRKIRVSDGTQMVEKVVNVDQWYLTIKHVYNC